MTDWLHNLREGFFVDEETVDRLHDYLYKRWMAGQTQTPVRQIMQELGLDIVALNEAINILRADGSIQTKKENPNGK